MTAPVLFEESGRCQRHAFRDRDADSPQTLNGLSLEMVELLAARLDAWARDPGVALVVPARRGREGVLPAATCTGCTAA